MTYDKDKRPRNRLSNSPVRAVKRGRRRLRAAPWIAFALLIATIAGVLFVFFAGGHAQPDNGAPDSLQWGEVLMKKEQWSRAVAARASNATAKRQEWADAVALFAEAHPEHVQARATQEQLVLEYARELATAGRYAEAAAVYQSLVARRPADAALKAELAGIRERQTVTREELRKVVSGQSRLEVQRELGVPPPGWTRASGGSEAWYYPRPDGGVAAIFFADGKVFAVEYESAASRGERNELRSAAAQPPAAKTPVGR